MRLIFMGTPDFAVPPLRALVEAGHEVAAVYTQPPRPAGRGQKPRPSPVARAAEELGIPVRAPLNFRDPAERRAFADIGAELAVVVAYGLILPPEVLAAPARGCFNIHASLLPRWRGAAPIQRAILAGDAETGVAIMEMEAGLDTGPVWLEGAIRIGPEDTAGCLHDRLSIMGAHLIVEAIDRIDALRPLPQALEGVTYASKVDKAEARIDWTASAAEIDRRIRAFSPFPGAWCEISGERVKLLASVLVPDSPGGAAPGTVLDDALTIACGDGALRLLRLQRAGKGPAAAQDFLRGFPVRPGAHLV
ncbi:methionyl-tRNA formyltransferase [Amaricoccus solimangrovi]|uniref:Methionyl-tRNA formyltransferase n=1 Tax=Amaricoccus solimangrovi TaxID=2589815 RepID=A0A501WRV3_9RHOB|nr:methionyl-tRNA formyltransferase [Amaricoccus solimangrovi]TPE52473.1 methionyl-tRNA formyltransferase [Amaricoccus solimangrovi]